MIGKWLTLCSDEALGDLLTEKLRPGKTYHSDGSRCLVGVVGDYYGQYKSLRSFPHIGPVYSDKNVAIRFDKLCPRFGIPRINAAIRERALKILAQRKETATCSANSSKPALTNSSMMC